MKIITSTFIALAASVGGLQAQVTNTWSGASSALWNLNANWVGNARPIANGTLVFAGSSNTSTTNDQLGDRSYAGIIFNSAASAFTLSGNRITLGGDITFSANPASAVTHTIDLDMVMSGARTLAPRANGTLVVNGVISQNSETARDLTIGATGGAGTVTLTGSNSFTGFMRASGGATVRISSIADAGVNSAAGAGSLLSLGNTTSSGTLVYTGAAASTDRQVNIGNGTNGTHSGSATILNEGTGVLTFANAAFNVEGTAGSTAARTLTLGGNSTGAGIVIQGVIADNNTGLGGIVSLNTWNGAAGSNNAVTLSGDNTFTGGVTHNQGTLKIGHNNALGTGGFTLNGGTFASDGATARIITNAVTIGGNVQMGDATGTGALTLSNIDLGTTTRTFTVSNSTTVAGTINNTGGLTMSGAGTLILGGNNTYTGSTTVESGTLIVTNATLSATIAPTDTVVNFATNSPAIGTYDVLSGPLNEASLASTAVTAAGGPLPAGLTATLANGPNLQITVSSSSSTAVIQVTGSAFGAFSTTVGSPSVAQTVSVSASGLTANLDITPPAGYEVSINGTTYSASLSLSPSGGAVAATTVYTRLTGASAGSFSGNVSFASTGAATQNRAASGTVTTVYDSWAAGYGLTGPSALPTADPDGDSFNNASEYAFGTVPTQGNGALVKTALSGGNLVMSWMERTDGAVAYAVQERVDLSTGSWLASGATVTAGSGATPPTGYTWKQISVPASGRKFYRVRAAY